MGNLFSLPNVEEICGCGTRRRPTTKVDTTDDAAGDSVAALLESEPLMGQDKWLGGVLGADGAGLKQGEASLRERGLRHGQGRSSS